jgi:hypothetical protein
VEGDIEIVEAGIGDSPDSISHDCDNDGSDLGSDKLKSTTTSRWYMLHG